MRKRTPLPRIHLNGEITFFEDSPAKCIRPTALADLLSIDIVTLHHWRKAGRVPKPIRLGVRSVAWRQCEIVEWLLNQPRAAF